MTNIMTYFIYRPRLYHAVERLLKPAISVYVGFNGLLIAVQLKSYKDRKPVKTMHEWMNEQTNEKLNKLKQAVRLATRYAPATLLPVGAPAPRAPPNRRNVAVVSQAQYVLTVTAVPASRVKAAVSKSAWWPRPLTFWPWKLHPSRMWCGLPLYQFWSS